MTVPNFMIIGAAKSGTTSLSAYCAQHPDIYVPPMKEARYLGYLGQIPSYRGYGRRGEEMMRRYDESLPKNGEAYRALFKAARPGQKTGEASPAYLYLKDAPARIRAEVPDVRLIAILRHPVERAFSSFTHLMRDDAEDLSFEEALDQERKRIRENCGLLWRYVDLGFYGKQIQRFYDAFSESQLMVLLHEDLTADPEGCMKKIFSFIGVNSGFTPDVGSRLNVSGVPRNRALYEGLTTTPMAYRLGRLFPKRWKRTLKKRIQSLLLQRPTLDQKTRVQLLACYESDLALLEKLIHRDLSHWRV